MDKQDFYGLPVLIVDDEPNILFSFRILLKPAPRIPADRKVNLLFREGIF